MLSEWWNDFRSRLRALIHRDAMEADLDAELAFHIECEAEKYERGGTPRDEAWRRARQAFGRMDRVKDAAREARGTVAIESFVQDVSYAWRGIRANPLFAAGVVVALSLGIGATTAMFGILDRLLLAPPTYLRDADRVHRVYLSWTADREQQHDRVTSIARYRDFARWTHAFSSVVAFGQWKIAVGDGEATREYQVAGTSGQYFDLFDARPALGRFFTPDDDRAPTGSPVVVLGYAYWQAALGGQRDVVGRQLHIGRMWFTVIGVAPADFVGLDETARPALYVPLAAFAWNARPEDHSSDYHWVWPEIVVKRAAGVSVAEANRDLTAAFARSWVAASAAAAHTESVAAARPRADLGPVQLARGRDAGPESKVAIWVAGVSVIVLLIACANVTNLLLARALARRRELSLRLALGVSHARLIRQVTAEALLLAGIGGAAGLVLARWGGAVVRSQFLPADLASTAVSDDRALIITLVTTLAAALLTAVAPALHAVHSSLSDALRGSVHGTSARSPRARAGLLFFQTALSVALLIGAGLFVRSLHRASGMRLGYDVDPVMVVAVFKRGVRMTPADEVALEARLAANAEGIPGVVSASPAASVPFWAFEGRDLFVAGIDSVSLLGRFLLQAGNPDYFRTLGTRILRGRGFTTGDVAHSGPVLVASVGMARVLWPGQDPLGKCIRIDSIAAPCRTVVGVAEDLHLRSLADSREYSYYLPMTQYDGPTGMLLVRTSGTAADYAETVRRRLQRDMPGASYVTTSELRRMVDPQMRSWRFGTIMFSALGALALILAAIGLYSVVSYEVIQQKQEIGIRRALGAQHAHILRLVVGGSLRIVIAGMALGSAIAFSIGGRLTPLLFDESVKDPTVYGAVTLTLIAVAFIASLAPALAAARVDPQAALRLH